MVDVPTDARPTLHRRLSVFVAAGLALAGCGSTSPGLSATRSKNAATDSIPIDTVPTVSTTTEATLPEDTTPSTDVDATAVTVPETVPDTTVAETAPPETTIPEMVDLPDNTIPFDGPFPFDPNKPPQEFDGLLVATINDLISWWQTEMPRVFGQEYPQLEGGVFPAYPQRTDYPSPGCFDSYDEIAGNGFYCPVGDYIVWDDTGYALPNYEDHGSGAVTGLMSHEWGHAIQQRTGVFDIVPFLSTVVIELQADCYSGAWFGHIARGESDLVSFTDADIRSGLIDTVLSADPVGTTPDEDGAHGAGFDRVAAFQDGFNQGSEQCATYAASPPPITEFGFTDEELSSDEDPGDLTYDELITLIPEDLEFFWQATLPDLFVPLTLVPFSGDAPTCGVTNMELNTNPLALFCPDNATVYLDEDGTGSALNQYGDFAPSYLMATAWADAAQTVQGSTLSGEARVLLNDCMVGVWAGSLPIEPDDVRSITISPGDLDEAVATAILLADDSAADDIRGDSFAKVDAFRIGVLDGMDGCTFNFG